MIWHSVDGAYCDRRYLLGGNYGCGTPATCILVVCWSCKYCKFTRLPGQLQLANSVPVFFSIHELNVDIANQMAQHIDIIEFQLFGHVDSGATWRICHICDGATVNVMLCLARSIDHYSVRPNII